MKLLFRQADKLYTLIAVIAVLFLVLNIFQFISNGNLQQDIVKREVANTLQKESIASLEASIKILEKQQEELIKRADAFQASELLYKNKYYETNKKLEAVINSYVVSSNDAKWSSFSRATRE